MVKGIEPEAFIFENVAGITQSKHSFVIDYMIKSFEGTDIEVLNGRYGPYITDGNKNAKIPKDKEPKSLTLEECEKLIAEAPERKGRKKKTAKKKAAPKKKAAAKKKSVKKKTAKKKTVKKKSAKKKATTKKK